MLSCFSHIQFFGTIWTLGHQDPPSMGFSVYGVLQAKNWRWLPCPPVADLPEPEMETVS